MLEEGGRDFSFLLISIASLYKLSAACRRFFFSSSVKTGAGPIEGPS